MHSPSRPLTARPEARLRHGLALTCLSLLFCLQPALATEGSELAELKAMGIEGLLDLEITSVAKKSQKLWGSAAAIYVIDQEQIRRSGLTSIPELLRLAPGIHVAKINANTWAITARGFNQRFSNKLLVLIDGRTVYTPLHSGVYWDLQDTVISDIERIEVIRGPGATIWGANAVNGVINIITKPAGDTQGNHLLARAGNEEQAGEFRHGGSLGPLADYRVYAKYFKRDGSADSTGNDSVDDWDGKQIGFRIDAETSPVDNLRLQGDLYNGDSGQTVSRTSGNIADRADRSGGNLLLAWERILGENSATRLQLFLDRTVREDAVTAETRNTFDIDFTHHFDRGQRQQINWGLGFRNSTDRLDPAVGSTFDVNPRHRTTQIWSGFLQDEITLIEDTLSTTLGAKIEHNDYTGWEFQPSARLAWTPDPTLTVWGAVSRAVRSPSRIESDFDLQVPVGPVGINLLGNPDLDSERLTAYELGFRKQLGGGLSIDTALFYNRYKNLVTQEIEAMAPANTPPYGLPPSSPLWVVNRFGNQMQGSSYGLEMTADWQVNPDWRLQANYSWLAVDLQLDPASSDTRSLPIAGYSPEHQFRLQSLWQVTPQIQFDSTLYFMEALDTLPVPSNTRIDLRLAWFPEKNIEASLVLQNALDQRHPEFTIDQGIVPREVERGFYGQVSWQF